MCFGKKKNVKLKQPSLLCLLLARLWLVTN